MLRTSQRLVARSSAANFAAIRRATSSSKPQGSGQTEQQGAGEKEAEQNAVKTSQEHKSTKKSLSQMDEEMRRAMEGLAGDGGEAGLELEDGKPVSMKRGVRENMFRYI